MAQAIWEPLWSINDTGRLVWARWFEYGRGRYGREELLKRLRNDDPGGDGDPLDLLEHYFFSCSSPSEDEPIE